MEYRFVFFVGFACVVAVISPNAGHSDDDLHREYPVESLREHIVAPSGSITTTTMGGDAIYG